MSQESDDVGMGESGENLTKARKSDFKKSCASNKRLGCFFPCVSYHGTRIPEVAKQHTEICRAPCSQLGSWFFMFLPSMCRGTCVQRATNASAAQAGTDVAGALQENAENKAIE